jgi:hypothetical protein
MNSAFNMFDSRRLWSLWEMYNLDMHILLKNFFHVKQLSEIGKNDPDWVFKDSLKIADLTKSFESIKEVANNLGLKLTKNKIGLITAGLGITQYGTSTLATNVSNNIADLENRFIEELEDHKFWHLGENASYLCSQVELIGTEIESAFPKTIEDWDEAAKCLAFERPTACVFHLMRAMELAVQRLYSELGLTGEIEREWGKLLSDIGKSIEAMPNASPEDKQARNKWSAAHTHLYHVKQAWRNEVMHPKQTYTEVEAKAVFDAVKSFMRHLSGLL